MKEEVEITLDMANTFDQMVEAQKNRDVHSYKEHHEEFCALSEKVMKHMEES